MNNSDTAPELKLPVKGEREYLAEVDQHPVLSDPRRSDALVQAIEFEFEQESSFGQYEQLKKTVTGEKWWIRSGNDELRSKVEAQPNKSQLKAMALTNRLIVSWSNELRESDRELLHKTAWLELKDSALRVKAADNQSVEFRILPHHLINPLMAWFIDEVYENLEQNIRVQLKSQISDDDEYREQIYLLMFLGKLLGKFDEDKAGEYIHFFRPFIRRDSPNYLKRIVERESSQGSVDSLHMVEERTSRLKGFWHSFFVQAWMAKARLQYDGKGALTQSDQKIGSSKLDQDERSADSVSAAQRSAETTYYRIGHEAYHPNRATQHYIAQELRLERVALQNQRQVRTEMDQILCLYCPDHQKLIDSKGHAVGEWSTFRQKIPLLFDTAAKFGAPLLRKRLSLAERDSTLALFAHELLSVVQREQDITALFGPDILQLQPLEQICIVLFTALSIDSKRQNARMAVELCSRSLVPLLSQTQLCVEIADQSIEQHPQTPIESIDWSSYRKRVMNAKQKLQHAITREDGFLGSESGDLQDFYKQVDGWEAQWKAIVPSFDRVSSRFGDAFDIIILLVYFFSNFVFGVGVNGIFFDLVGAREINIPITAFLFAIVAVINIVSHLYSTKEVLPRANIEKISRNISNIELAKYYQLSSELTTAIQNFQKKDQTKKYEKFFGPLFFIVAFALLTPVQLNSVLSDELDTQAGQFVSVGREFHSFVPDQVSTEALRSVPWSYRGDISQEGAVPGSATAVGYQSDTWIGAYDRNFSSPSMQELVNTEFVDDLSQITYQPTDGEIMYGLVGTGTTIYPMDGFQIVRVFQIGGSAPQIGSAGELHFDAKNLPEKVVLVARELQPSESEESGRVLEYAEMVGPQYAPWADWETKYQRSLQLNATLSGDLKLQSLHLAMINEADELVRMWQDNRINEDQLRDRYSQLGKRYLLQYVHYIQSTRMYSLLFSGTDIPGTTVLEDVSLDENKAFYCSVAAMSVRDFMQSIDIAVLLKPGSTLFAKDGHLYSRIGHMTALVLFPNTEMVNVDTTPGTPNPGEDLSSLENPQIPDGIYEQLQYPDEKMNKLVRLVVGATGILSLGGTAEIIRRRRRWSKMSLHEKIEHQLPRENADTVVQTAQKTVQMLLLLSTQKDSEQFGNFHGSKLAAFEILSQDALRWLSTPNGTGNENQKINLDALKIVRTEKSQELDRQKQEMRKEHAKLLAESQWYAQQIGLAKKGKPSAMSMDMARERLRHTESLLRQTEHGLELTEQAYDRTLFIQGLETVIASLKTIQKERLRELKKQQQDARDEHAQLMDESQWLSEQITFYEENPENQTDLESAKERLQQCEMLLRRTEYNLEAIESEYNQVIDVKVTHLRRVLNEILKFVRAN